MKQESAPGFGKKSVFKKIEEGAKKITRIGIFAAAGISTVAGAAPDAGAQTKANEVKTTQTQEAKIDEASVTRTGKFFKNLVDSAKMELPTVTDITSANTFLTKFAGVFTEQYYMPEGDKVEVKEGSYGTSQIVASKSDRQLMLKEAEAMQSIIEKLNKKFGVGTHYVDQFNNIVVHARVQASSSGQSEEEILNRVNGEYK